MKTNTPAGGNPTLSPTTAWLRIVMLESFKTHKEKVLSSATALMFKGSFSNGKLFII